jgi:nucleotide-binding universal stress UspA family protein
MNILVAIDLSPASAKIVEAARGVAELTSASVFVLHVAERLHREHKAVSLECLV